MATNQTPEVNKPVVPETTAIPEIKTESVVPEVKDEPVPHPEIKNESVVDMKMPEVKPEATGTIVKTEPVTPIIDPVPEIKKEPVVPPVVKAEQPKVSAAADPSKSHKDRIVAFLSDKKGTVKLNDFLKSLWPISKNESPEFTKPENVRVLRRELMELKDSGAVRFSSDSYTRLGKAFWPDNSGLTKYYDLTNLPIEAVVS